MPAGLTHISLSRLCLDWISPEARTAKIILNAEIGPYLLGCIGPDIPYMGNFENNPFSNNNDVADSLHYHKTNQLPLQGLVLAKKELAAGNTELADSLFAFFIGYASHLIADGIIHPFVRDMVGDYEPNKTEHRALEMKLDVLVATKLLGVEVNGVSIQDDLQWIEASPHITQVLKAFSELIKEIHNKDLSISKLSDLADGMKLALDIAEGQFPEWYRSFGGKHALAYMNQNEVFAKEIDLTILTLPKDAAEKGLIQNFMKKNEVSFFEDVIPQYFNTFPKVIEGAYKFVYEEGPEITDLIPAINLDTGRMIANQDLKETPALWVIA